MWCNGNIAAMSVYEVTTRRWLTCEYCLDTQSGRELLLNLCSNGNYHNLGRKQLIRSIVSKVKIIIYTHDEVKELLSWSVNVQSTHFTSSYERNQRSVKSTSRKGGFLHFCIHATKFTCSGHKLIPSGMKIFRPAVPNSIWTHFWELQVNGTLQRLQQTFPGWESLV